MRGIVPPACHCQPQRQREPWAYRRPFPQCALISYSADALISRETPALIAVCLNAPRTRVEASEPAPMTLNSYTLCQTGSTSCQSSVYALYSLTAGLFSCSVNTAKAGFSRIVHPKCFIIYFITYRQNTYNLNVL